MTPRAIAPGKLRIVNIRVPAFDPHDQWFD